MNNTNNTNSMNYKKQMSSLAAERFSLSNAPSFREVYYDAVNEQRQRRNNRVKYSNRLKDKNINLTINNSVNECAPLFQ